MQLYIYILYEQILEWIAPMKHEGSTATIVYIENNYIFTANIGDSKAVLCRLHKDTTKITNKLKILLLTKDYTVLQLNELNMMLELRLHSALPIGFNH